MTKKESKISKTGPFIYQIKVTLEDSEPLIWRRIQVMGNSSLRKLHKILQAVMGWETRHLHEFIVGREHFGEPDPEYGFEMQDDRKTRLHEVAPRYGDRFAYVYDFGDGWRHELTVEKIELPKPDTDSNSAQPGINQTGVRGLTLLIPATDVVRAFDKQVEPLIEKLFKNCLESRTLAAIRDALLPKLLSGQIRVKYVETVGEIVR